MNMNALAAFHALAGGGSGQTLPAGMQWLEGQTYPPRWPKNYRAALRAPDLTMMGQLAQAHAQLQAQQQQGPASLPAPQQAQMPPQQQQVPWVREQVYYPTPYFPQHPNLGRQVRDYVRNFTIAAASTTTSQTLQVDVPGVIYAITGGVIRTDGSAFPVGWDPLDAFSIQFTYNNGEQLTTLAGLGGAIVGRGRFPRLLGGPAWTFDRGAQVNIAITSNLANLQITIACWVAEIRGPTNISSLG